VQGRGDDRWALRPLAVAATGRPRTPAPGRDLHARSGASTSSDQKHGSAALARLLFDGNSVTFARGTGSFYDRIHTRARKQTSGNIEPIVLRHRPKHVVISREVILFECGHHASRIGKEHGKPDAVTELHGPPGPGVLDEAVLRRSDNDIHAEATLIKATSWG
jgi:hypothetical protein